MRDTVDDLQDQWSALRPDLDLDAMATMGRLMRLSRLADTRIKGYFAQHGLESWEFDVLATLHRNRRPLTAKALAASVMIGSAALTNRVDRLVQRGLVTREAVPGDRRSLHVTLTDEGRELVERTVQGHVENEADFLSVLDADERGELNRILRKLLVARDQT